MQLSYKPTEVATVDRYFESFNQNDFVQTATLFAPTGRLHAPFESPIEGRAAVLDYLRQEASNMRAFPAEHCSETLADGQTEVTVRGQVQTAAFRVNVEWRFVLTAAAAIAAVHVKLLASMKDLLSLRPRSHSA
ncbi:MAG: nuclear transport factor 2 family protein [Leptolyngbya sp. SIO4C1]|nr:nuclear transport factor 2 family protein [Leptolyngbya sp. SIO4C1]